MAWIYKIENTENGKVYVGQSRNVEGRWSQHRSLLRTGKHPNAVLQKEWVRMGAAVFRFDVLMTCRDDEASQCEMAFITRLGAIAPAGYNYSVAMFSEAARAGFRKQRERWAGPADRYWSEICRICLRPLAVEEGYGPGAMRLAENGRTIDGPDRYLGECDDCRHERVRDTTVVRDVPHFLGQ